MPVCSLGQEDPWEEEMATHSSTHAWRIPRTEEPGGLQSQTPLKWLTHGSFRIFILLGVLVSNSASAGSERACLLPWDEYSSLSLSLCFLLRPRQVPRKPRCSLFEAPASIQAAGYFLFFSGDLKYALQLLTISVIYEYSERSSE